MPNEPPDDIAGQRRPARPEAVRPVADAPLESAGESPPGIGKQNDASGVQGSERVKPSDVTEKEWRELRQKLMFYYRRRGSANAEDLVQEALFRLVKWLEHGELKGEGGFVKLAYGIARLVRKEDMRSNRQTFLELPDVIPGSITPPHALTPIESARQLNQLLGYLPKKKRDLLLKAETIPPEQLAEEYGVVLSTLRVWLYRARAELRELEQNLNK